MMHGQKNIKKLANVLNKRQRTAKTVAFLVGSWQWAKQHSLRKKKKKRILSA
jgi:hypothetical protein